MKGAGVRRRRNRLALLGLSAALLAGSCLTDFGGLSHEQQAPGTPPGTPPPPPPGGPPPPPPPSQRVARVVITREGPDTLVALGRRLTLRAEALDAAGRVMPGIAFAWTVDQPLLVELDPDRDEARLEAIANGTAAVSVTAQGVSATAMVVVWQRVVDVELTPNNREVDLFKTVELSGFAYDPDDHRVVRPLVWTWSADRVTVVITPHADDGSKATVKRVLNGRTIITVRAEGESDTATIR